GSRMSAVTDDTGAYSFRDVPPGDYVLEVRAEGFASFVSEKIGLARGQSLTNDVQLAIRTIDENVVVIASGMPQRADEVSKAVTLIGSDQIEARHEVSVAEALRQTPGVRVQQQGSIGALTTVRLRGQRNFDTAVLFDGLRVRDASDINGSPAVVIPDLLNTDLDRIEVLRGSGSSIYGTNAIGGVINLVPKVGAG